ncbi:hypothetical protein PC129_g21687 [Phytophthora cactorum]|uniref:Uncharacterized protein n=1 Tax=Phytophthora cactorum TaxID=29920 RepID=A0A329RFR2_9STRA|nr:hypothetical protein Pcac1_g12193 [Phytophthora cactorum]KAG2795756.1 hypothetical protein PC111_g22014 [Phytophthora cactorum]KAG2799399.1 hypothetical protein PC112_g20919 [Phytophthora cactorum]KAG2823318.1 hypothetical protein PC113_g22205 [Phytophthora cactorum]KAG2875076.1 hypothetical protein PC114_g24930 [Phytophthora cactorum]
MAFITMEGAKASFNLFCCAYGIGTLSILGNFSRAGPVLGIIGMAFMAFASIYGATSILPCDVTCTATWANGYWAKPVDTSRSWFKWQTV